MPDHDARENCLVTTEWLANHLHDPNLALVDASWYLPTQGRDAEQEFLAGHIPGAVFFDIDAFSDRASTLPHMLPSADAFGEAVGRLGIAEKNRIVVYDGAGLYSAPRVWWTFLAFGATDVRILDGGYPRWTAEGRAVEGGHSLRPLAHFAARPVAGAVADIAAVQGALEDGGAQVLDARPAARFRGKAPEPRPGLRSGHMPGSVNVPFDLLVHGGSLKAADTLRSTLSARGVNLAKRQITTCGSGVTAAVVAFALATLGNADVSLYDGAWAEWGSKGDLPVETGE